MDHIPTRRGEKKKMIQKPKSENDTSTFNAVNKLKTRKLSKRDRMQSRPDKTWIAPPQKQLLDYQRSIKDLLFISKRKG